jgi:hypothetical protein
MHFTVSENKVMNREGSSTKEMFPMKTKKSRFKFIEWTAIFPTAIVSVLAVIVTILAGIGLNIISELYFLNIPSAFLTIMVIVLSIGVGLGSVFYLASYLYRRQTQKRKEELKAVREKEKDFFQSIESDVEALLKEESH